MLSILLMAAENWCLQWDLLNYFYPTDMKTLLINAIFISPNFEIVYLQASELVINNFYAFSGSSSNSLIVLECRDLV